MPASSDLPGAAAARFVEPGHLYVVATPIGNLGDLSPRAVRVLAGVDRIAAEDTRTTAQLLHHFGIRTPLLALHEHNEDAIADGLVETLRTGQSLAIVSDAGTPLLSDPGFALVRAARAAGVPVIAVPGPSAVLAALTVSGLPTDRFVFAGFLPARGTARRRALSELSREPRTVVLFESSHRIAQCLDDILAVCGPERRLCIARELTKLHEESALMNAGEAKAWLAADPYRTKGEFVIVLSGAREREAAMLETGEVLRVLLQELSASKAARIAAMLTGGDRKALYAEAVKLSNAVK